MNDELLTRPDLGRFFTVKERGLGRVLRALDIRLLGATTRWSVVWRALGLADIQDPAHWADLTAPLLTAKGVAERIGVADPSIVYRWEKGQLPAGALPFPKAIDLSNGHENARAKRWRRADVLAWHAQRPCTRYAKPAPVFGALAPKT
jgi:predicted DNA-binding transcriptional regulator AlpA